MKKIKYIYTLLLLLIVISQGCTSNFDKINDNPNETSNVPTPFILSYTQRLNAYNCSDSWNDVQQAGVASQIIAQAYYTAESRYNFRRGTSNSFFSNTYTNMTGYTKIIELNTDEASKGEMSAYGDNAMQIATCTLLRIWGVQMLAETFGDVPYSEAFLAQNNIHPKYDKQSELFPQFIKDIDGAIAQLKSSEKGWTKGDLIYDGDIQKWLKFANTMKLRIAIRISNVYPNWKQVANEAIADGIFESNEDNAGVQFLGDGYPNRAPLYTATIERDDFRLSKQYVNLVKGMDDPNINFENPFNGCTDPRLAAFIGEANVEAGRVDGFPYGVSETAATEYRGLNADIMLLKTTPRPVIVTPDYYVRMLDYPTACFMKCEANDWNAADFEEGINASIEMWSAGISKNNLDDYFSEGKSYVSDVMSKFASADTEKKKEMVITQKYMHLLTQSYEAWAEYRRTGYPKSVLLPGDVSLEEIYEVESANKVENKVVKYLFEPSVETGGIVVSRLLYNSSEYSLNQTNVEAAAASIGGDTYSTILWWAKATRR